MCRRLVLLWVFRCPFAPDPSLFGGVRLIAFALGVLLVLSYCSAHGEPLPPRQQRTASWYVANSKALEYVTRLCRDDPGNLRHSPDCINAAQARLILAEREADAEARGRRGTVRRWGDLTPPSSPRYWRDRPEELREKLAYCDRLSPAAQERFFCAAARAAAGGHRL